MKKLYKVRRTDTGEYWSGYSSMFSKDGEEYHSIEIAANALSSQRSLLHVSIDSWIGVSEIVEYEVVRNERTSSSAIAEVIRYAQYAELAKQHGNDFVNGYKRMLQQPVEFDYAFQIWYKEYEEFRITLKGLGHSSRSYKKTGNWIWVNDRDVALKVKLLGSFAKSVELEPIRDEFRKRLAESSYVKSNKLPR